jgi:hypothetical protein
MSPIRPLLVVAVAMLPGGCGSTPGNTGDLMHVSCLVEPDRGPCSGAKPGFYYDYRDDRCKRFIYGGCGGKVPFATLEQCVETCGGRPAR